MDAEGFPWKNCLISILSNMPTKSAALSANAREVVANDAKLHLTNVQICTLNTGRLHSVRRPFLPQFS